MISTEDGLAIGVFGRCYVYF